MSPGPPGSRSPAPARWSAGRGRDLSEAPGRKATSSPSPSGRRSCRVAATSRARWVLPTPPGPVKVSRRTSSRRNSVSTAATSCSRPTSAVGGRGGAALILPWLGVGVGAGVMVGVRDRADMRGRGAGAPAAARSVLSPSASPSAPARRRAVSRKGRLSPCSRFWMLRTLTLARSASASCVSPASRR